MFFICTLSFFKKKKNQYSWRGNLFNWSVVKTKFSKENFLKIDKIKVHLEEHKKKIGLTKEKQMDFDINFKINFKKIQELIEHKINRHPQVKLSELKRFGIKIYFALTTKSKTVNVFTKKEVENTKLDFEVFPKLYESQIINDLYKKTKLKKQEQFINNIGIIENKKEEIINEIIQTIREEELSIDEIQTLNYIEQNLQEKEHLLTHVFEKTLTNWELCIMKQISLNQKIDLCFMHIEDFAQQLINLLS